MHLHYTIQKYADISQCFIHQTNQKTDGSTKWAFVQPDELKEKNLHVKY